MSRMSALTTELLDKNVGDLQQWLHFVYGLSICICILCSENAWWLRPVVKIGRRIIIL